MDGIHYIIYKPSYVFRITNGLPQGSHVVMAELETIQDLRYNVNVL